jgi:hypothetical protein
LSCSPFSGERRGSGPNRTLVDQINQFFDSILTSELIDLLAEYSVSGMSIGHGRRIGSATITDTEQGGISRQVSDAQIQQALQNLEARTIPATATNTLYFVYLPPNVTVSDPQGGQSCQVLCGYHRYFDGTNPEENYAIMPFPGCSGCLGAVYQLDALTSISSHELCEAITDPHP